MSHHYSILTTVPSSDQNFKEALLDAPLEALSDALEARAQAGSKTAYQAIRAEITRRLKEARPNARPIDTYEEARERLAAEITPAPEAPAQPQAPALPEKDQDTQMGRQLAAQWDKVVSGQRDQILFGAMMLRIRERCESAAHCAANFVARRGPTVKDTGLTGWLAQYSPEVSKQTAYRLMEIAEGVIAEFKLGKKADLEALLAAQVEQLTGKLAEQRAKIEECIAGKSQRQLLLAFGRGGDGRAKNPGGYRPNALILRAWLEQEYPARPELLAHACCFAALPVDVQERFRAEGQRYEERLTLEQKAEIETAASAREWNSTAPRQLLEALDRGLYERSTDEELNAWHTALKDVLDRVTEQKRLRANKRFSGAARTALAFDAAAEAQI